MSVPKNEINSSIFDDLAMIFEYPCDEMFPVLSSLIIKFSSQPLLQYQSINKKLQIYFDYFSKNNLGKIEEDYVSTFEMNTKYILYIGHILFGENYERSNYISYLNELYQENEFVIKNNELPDHVSVILKFFSINDVPLKNKKPLFQDFIKTFERKSDEPQILPETFLINLEDKNKYPLLYSILFDLAQLLKTWEFE